MCLCRPAAQKEWKMLEACLGPLKEEICLSLSFLKYQTTFWHFFFQIYFWAGNMAHAENSRGLKRNAVSSLSALSPAATRHPCQGRPASVSLHPVEKSVHARNNDNDDDDDNTTDNHTYYGELTALELVFQVFYLHDLIDPGTGPVR